jgi:2-polyprenyl-3-methyl-5-hydroxy-6-metoxy-1,4-benzoquinol methylase
MSVKGSNLRSKITKEGEISFDFPLVVNMIEHIEDHTNMLSVTVSLPNGHVWYLNLGTKVMLKLQAEINKRQP